MRTYVARRVCLAIITLFVIITLNFFVFRLMPGDPLSMQVRSLRLSQEAAQQLERLYGLDKPMIVQFAAYVKNLLTFNFGSSFKFKTDVGALIGRRLANTAVLVPGAVIVAIVSGTALGLIAGWFRGRGIDIAVLVFGLFSWSMPTFWVAMTAVTVLKGVLPSGRMTSAISRNPALLEYLLDVGRHAVLPTLVLGLLLLGEYVLLVRNETSTIITEDFIRTAKAKGVRPSGIISHHVLRNASLPILSAASLSVVYLIGGDLQVEVVFSWPGIGRLFYEAALARDYPVLQGAFYVLSVGVLCVNLLADIAYKVLDPRINY